MVKKKKAKKKGEKVEEYFELEKGGKKKIVKTSGIIPEHKVTKSEVKRYNRVLVWFFVLVAIVAVLILAYYFFSYYQIHINYRGVEFTLIKEGDLYFYDTTIPINERGKIINHHLYTRSNPKDLDESIPFLGKVKIQDIVILNSTSDFVCDGDGAISVGNLVNFFSIVGAKSGRDVNATCDPLSRYTYLLLKESETNKIEQIDDSCYVLSIKDCEILKVTERFIYESLVEIDKKSG